MSGAKDREPASAPEQMDGSRIPDRPVSGLGYTNFDGSMDAGLETALRNGMLGEHAAWNFHGELWYDADAGLFFEEVWRFGSPIEVLSSPSLLDVIDVANDTYGAD